MSKNGFLPSTDTGLLTWAQSASGFITATPTAYGLAAGIASSFAALVSTYATSLAACEPGVRTRMATATKNNARLALKNSARAWAKIVEGTTTVTNAQKLQLGLTVRSQPQPIPPPSVAPAVDVVMVSGRVVKIRIHDASGEAKRRKPAGCKGAAIFSFTGATAPTDPSLYKWEGNTTQSIADIAFPTTLTPGTQVWITAMWFNERQQNGPACTPVGAVIQYGMSAAA